MADEFCNLDYGTYASLNDFFLWDLCGKVRTTPSYGFMRQEGI